MTIIATLFAGLPGCRRPPRDLRDLPIVACPVADARRDFLAVVVSGDGGFNITERGIARSLNRAGIPVVGLNSLRYFWKRRTPEEAARDVGRMIAYFEAAWHTGRVVLVGYSRGADVLPFVVNRLPDELRARVAVVALLNPAPLTDFKIHLRDLYSARPHPTSRPVLPEVERISGPALICAHGETEHGSLCPCIPEGRVEQVIQKGGHLVLWNYGPVVAAILRAIS